MSNMAGKGEGIPEAEEIFGVRKHKNAVTMQTAGIALRRCEEDHTLVKSLLNYALSETGLKPGDVDRLIGMAKAGGSEKEKIEAYLEKIKDDRNY